MEIITLSQTMRQFYGLTKSEARLLDAMIAGKRIEEAAEEFGVARSTVRNQLQSVFRKTETGRQAELVRLVLTGPARFATQANQRNGRL